MGVVATTTVGFVAAGAASSAAQPRKKSTAMVVLSGDRGRYLQFTGKETRPAAFKGSVVFKRPITTGTYTSLSALLGSYFSPHPSARLAAWSESASIWALSARSLRALANQGS